MVENAVTQMSIDMIKIKRGLDIPLAGAPSAEIESAPATRAVALLGGDYHGMKPTMAVQVGDVVKRGDLLFTDKKCEGVRYTAPAGGRVASINRGAQRAFQSVVIEIDGDEPALFQQYSSEAARELSPETIKQQLIESGQWTALKARPFGRVADPATTPAGLFITAIDTHPHAPDPEQLIALEAEAFEVGQVLLANMVACPVYLCAAPDAQMPQAAHERLSRHDFSGPHPAGLAGTHVHFLMGASVEKIAWTIGYQDVIAMGRLFLDGALYTDRIISLAGPAVSRPRLVSSRVGADLQALVAGEQHAEEARLLSGSVLGGARGAERYRVPRSLPSTSLLATRGTRSRLHGVVITRTAEAFGNGDLFIELAGQQAAGHVDQYQRLGARDGAGRRLRKSHAARYFADAAAAGTAGRRYRDCSGIGLSRA